MNTAHLALALNKLLVLKPILVLNTPEQASIHYHSSSLPRKAVDAVLKGRSIKDILPNEGYMADHYLFDFVPSQDGQNILVRMSVSVRGKYKYSANYGTFKTHGFLRNPKIKALGLFDWAKVQKLAEESK